ncbi:MAG: LIC_13355 family lipoprotein [Deltaproteobacteria bacterium]|nr:LIC_13355 family lipoprotein [Deltaproteobacteria bacterium]
MRSQTLMLVMLLLALAGCPAVDDDDSANDDDSAAMDDDDVTLLDPCDYGLDRVCADEVVDAPGADFDAPFLNPARAVNGVRGLGDDAGGTDVFSLDWDSGSSLTLRWSDRRVLNGPGPDVVVFENPFRAGSGVFMDLVVVEVSIDGVEWMAFPHDYVADDELEYSSDPQAWVGFAGRTPVRLHEEENPIDPLSLEAGGDAFDLDAMPEDGGLGSALRSDGFTYLRLVTAPARTNPDTGEPFVGDVISNGADIDGVYARSLVEAD